MTVEPEPTTLYRYAKCPSCGDRGDVEHMVACFQERAVRLADLAEQSAVSRAYNAVRGLGVLSDTDLGRVRHALHHHDVPEPEQTRSRRLFQVATVAALETGHMMFCGCGECTDARDDAR